MEVRRSRGGKVALVVGGNNIVKFIMLDANGTKFGSMSTKDFDVEFNKVLEIPVMNAAMSFLKTSKRAFKHSPEVIKFLTGEIILKNLVESPLAELVLVYNNLCVAAGKKPRKAFDSKAAALEAIEKLDATLQLATPCQEQAAKKSNQLRSNTMSEENKEVKPRGKGIGARAMELLLEGKGTMEVIEIVSREIEGANPTPATIAWYKNKLRQEGKLAKPEKKEPSEKKPRKSKKAAEAEADVAAE